MMSLLDYLYYRFAKAYYRWDGQSGITGIMAVALFISLSIIDILGFFYLNVFSNDFRVQNKETVKFIGIIIIGIVILFSLKRYRNKFSVYDEKWGNEARSKKFTKGILVVLILILPIVIPIVLLIVFN